MSSESPRRSRKTWIVAAVITVVAAVIAWRLFFSAEAPPKKAGAPVAPVAVERVRTEDVPQIARSMGRVQSMHEVVVRTQVAGVLEEVFFKEGQTVKKGDVLARIDDRVIRAEVATARADKKKSEAQLTTARIDLVRYSNLFNQQAIAKQQVDQQQALVEQLEATVAANDAAIAVAEARLSYTRITSPVAGRVGLRRVDAGNFVQSSDAQGLVSVTQLEPINVVFALSQDLLPVLQPFLDNAPAPVVALDRPSGTVLAEGRLAVVDNQVDQTTGTVELKAEFLNRPQTLWPGQSVTVELETGKSAGAVVVSTKAVQRGLNGTFVYRVKDDVAEVVNVRVGHEHEGLAVILEGLAAGDVVVVDGHSRVTPKGRVKVIDQQQKQPNPVAKEG